LAGFATGGDIIPPSPTPAPDAPAALSERNVPMPALERPLMKPRPVYLDLFRIRMPMPSVVSFLHRLTGALMLLFGIPLLLVGVDASLASPESYANLQATLAHPLAKLVLLGFAWAFFHHFTAGIRHLLLDVHVGVDLEPARRSSVVVFVVSLALTIAVGAKLW
jgi:succinate dehydrogenase / fumarate reductase cytochrome b subunit